MKTKEDLTITFFEGSAQELPEDILNSFFSMEGKIFKDNQNSFVKLVEYHGTKLVLKEPRAKNKRLQTRLLTLFRDSRAVQALKSMTFVRLHDIETNRPVCALEYRKYGMVFRAFFIYEYLEGEEIKPEHFGELAALVHKLNQLGFGHSDCHRGNFLKTRTSVAPIDFVLRKNRYGRIFEDFEYLKLFEHLPDHEFEELYPYHVSPRLKFSRVLYSLKCNFRLFRKTVKKHRYFILFVFIGYSMLMDDV